jgi:hypothetical protein
MELTLTRNLGRVDGYILLEQCVLLLPPSILHLWPLAARQQVFSASKVTHRKELQKFLSLTDSAPVDKVTFIRASAKAREVGMAKKNILSG